MTLWIASEPNPPEPRLLPGFLMFGVLGTWMEADVVGATVQNALTQGCERVYLVDNGSTDGTVEAATAAGAILVRFYATDKYDEELRLQQMNEVVAEVSAREDSAHIWWLYLDADEFAHGPWGMTLRAYLETLDERFRAVGTRYFNHYPSTQPYYISDRHPLDFQPLCEELAYPMCPSSHRKHPLLRYDRDGVGIRAGKGFHIAHADELLYEPADPAFLHHFPFRDEEVTRRRLRTLWEMNQAGHSRALETRDTHMLARARSLDAVYRQDWKTVYNFAPLDPMRSSLSAVPPQGVDVKPWGECVQSEHQHVPRWYPMVGAWRYEELQPFMYGDDTTYGKGLAFLDGHGTIEDWGSGFGHAKQFIRHSPYVGVDGSSPHADKQVDLRDHTSSVDCIFMRHVLEHNTDWRRILTNAVASFKKRMVIVIFTPFAETTHQIATSTVVTSIPVPDISFKKEDLSAYFKGFRWTQETVHTQSQYGLEHIFYIERAESLDATATATTIDALRRELDAWEEAGLSVGFWVRDDDAISDTPNLQRLLALVTNVGVAPAIAVVPERADESLVALLTDVDCAVWQHGYSHNPYGSLGEFGDGRPLAQMTEDARCGRAALDRLFGPTGWQPVFVPPYHLISVSFKELLPQLGYWGLSAGFPMAPRLDGVVEMNAEIDVMDWPARRPLGDGALQALIVGQLESRRRGDIPTSRPIGLLTHHLAFDEEAWRLVNGLIEVLASHAAVQFLRADTLFPKPDAGGSVAER